MLLADFSLLAFLNAFTLPLSSVEISFIVNCYKWWLPFGLSFLSFFFFWFRKLSKTWLFNCFVEETAFLIVCVCERGYMHIGVHSEEDIGCPSQSCYFTIFCLWGSFSLSLGLTSGLGLQSVSLSDPPVTAPPPSVEVAYMYMTIKLGRWGQESKLRSS